MRFSISAVGAHLLLLASANAQQLLPNYTGPYLVGTVDIEVPVSSPRNISQITFKNGQPAFELQTVLFSLFYPGTVTNSTRSQHPWAPPPISLLADGFARYAAASGSNISAQFIEIGLNAIASDLSIPAQVDARIVRDNQTFPVIIFSHGDAGIRTFYSHYLGELASRGAIVAAIEHRDGSGPASAIIRDGLQRNVTYFSVRDVSPNMTQLDFNFAQRAFRQAEILETYKVLSAVNNGSGAAVQRNNSRNAEGQTLSEWQGRLDFNRFVVSGHSYGATTALQVLEANATSSIPAKAGLVLDPGKSSGPLNLNVSVPLLIADSQGWSSVPSPFYGGQHFDVVKSVAQSAMNKTGAAWFITLLGASHATITDAPLISSQFNAFFDYGYNATIGSLAGIGQYVNASVEFLTYLGNGTKGPILSTPVTNAQFSNSSAANASSNSDAVRRYWQIHVSSANSTATNGSSPGAGSGGSRPSQASSLLRADGGGLSFALIVALTALVLTQY